MITKEDKIKKIYEVVGDRQQQVTPWLMVWDVLDWINNAHDNYTIQEVWKNHILRMWKLLRKPIDWQDEKCIDFIFSLLN
jgi:hypothetical protein